MKSNAHAQWDFFLYETDRSSTPQSYKPPQSTSFHQSLQYPRFITFRPKTFPTPSFPQFWLFSSFLSMAITTLAAFLPLPPPDSISIHVLYLARLLSTPAHWHIYNIHLNMVEKIPLLYNSTVCSKTWCLKYMDHKFFHAAQLIIDYKYFSVCDKNLFSYMFVWLDYKLC